MCFIIKWGNESSLYVGVSKLDFSGLCVSVNYFKLSIIWNCFGWYRLEIIVSDRDIGWREVSFM